MKFVVHERSRIHKFWDNNTIGIFLSMAQAFDAIKARQARMTEMYGVNKRYTYNNEKLEIFTFKGAKSEDAYWWIEKREKWNKK